jgi:hypothetical protein
VQAAGRPWPGEGREEGASHKCRPARELWPGGRWKEGANGSRSGRQRALDGGAARNGVGWRCHGEWDERADICGEFFLKREREHPDGADVRGQALSKQKRSVPIPGSPVHERIILCVHSN